jgi:isoleucyl-tRNA synthetase
VIPADADMQNLVKKIKPNFKTLGKKYSQQMKEIAQAMTSFGKSEIATIEKQGEYTLSLASGEVLLTTEDVEIITEDMPGWLVANEGKLTVALDITVTEQLFREGIARELVNRIQNIRKSSGFEIVDRIIVKIDCDGQREVQDAVNEYADYIAIQTLANKVGVEDNLQDALLVEFDEFAIKLIVIKDENE